MRFGASVGCADLRSWIPESGVSVGSPLTLSILYATQELDKNGTVNVDVVFREPPPTGFEIPHTDRSILFFPDKSEVYSIILDFARKTSRVFTHDDILAELSAKDVQVGNIRDYTRRLVDAGYLLRIKNGTFTTGGKT